MLVNTPDGFPSGQQPVAWWFGLDSGHGQHAIGPNGPWNAHGGVPAVTRATSLITDPITQVQWMARGSDGLMEQPPRWVRDPMLTRPDDRAGLAIWPHSHRLNRAAFWSAAIRSALWWGMGGVIYVENEDGTPRVGSLYLLHHHGFEPTDRGTYEIGLRTNEQPIETDRDGRFSIGGVQWRVVVLRNPASPISETGRSFGVFEMHPDVFTIATRQSSYEAAQFRTGVPAGYLKTSKPGMTQEQADELRRKWLENHGGDRRSIAVLNSTTEFQSVSMSPIESGLQGLKSSSLVDIANAFNMDPSMIGGPSGDSSTYSNVESRWSQFRITTLGRWIVDIEETFGALLPYLTDLHINFDELLRGDTASRFEAYSTALGDGWMTVAEVREREALPPLPDSDAFAGDSNAREAPARVAQQVVQAVQNGVLTVPEARAMIAEAGAELNPEEVPPYGEKYEEEPQPVPAALEPALEEENEDEAAE